MDDIASKLEISIIIKNASFEISKSLINPSIVT